jgi:hypothetical protein
MTHIVNTLWAIYSEKVYGQFGRIKDIGLLEKK